MNEKSIKEIEKLLNSNLQTGLSSIEAKRRLERDGTNEIDHHSKQSIVFIFIEQFRDPMVFILFIGAILSLLLHEIIDAFIICLVVLLNACIGTFQLIKSEKALDALKALMQPTCLVIRDNQNKEINTSDVVIGDIIEFEAGNCIPCDIRLISTARLMMDESLLTGESIPIQKNEYHTKQNMVFMSTYVSSGRGKGIAVKVGMNTEMGKIASLLTEENKQLTPLQIRMNSLSKIFGAIAIIICVLIMIINVYEGKNFIETLILAISLAVAAIPEGLVAVVTIVQSFGMNQMSKNNAIVRKLGALDSLGSINIICSDKTGTLTQNKMSVTSNYFNHEFNQPIPNIALIAMGCCQNVKINEHELLGDASEKALVEEVLKTKNIHEINCEYIKIDEIPFDSIRKKMTTIHQKNNEQISFSKGSIENIIKQCNMIYYKENSKLLDEYEKKRILEATSIMEKQALRVFAYCMKKSNLSNKNYEENCTFLGIIGLKDPIKPEVTKAIEIAKNAGIEVVMITGDSINTASAIGKECNLIQDEKQVLLGSKLDELKDYELKEKIKEIKIFARVSPSHKVRLVETYQSLGKIVAMSGDGVNDAPALKKADVGIAMGKLGSDVCKSVSELILTDDNFSTIITAIEAGRNIYLKIQKCVYYLLSCNLGEIITLGIASLFMNDLVVPLIAIQLLWTNLVTDALPALALGVEKDEDNVMNQKPKKMNENLFAHGGILFILLNGFYIGMISLVAFKIGYQVSPIIGQTMSFMVLSISQMFHSLNCRSVHQSMFKIGFFQNKWLIFTISCGIILQILVCQLPFMNLLLKTSPLNIREWIVVFSLSISTIFINEISKVFN